MDGGAAAVLGVVALIASVVLVILRGKRRRLPTINVVALGLSGSGKTVLLSSMHGRLGTPSANRGYYTRPPLDQQQRLDRWLRQVSDSDQDWPRGTTRGQIRTFDFAFHQDDRTEGRTRHVFNMSYLEYPGELLTDEDPAALDPLTTAIDEADALIGIVDGQMVRKAIKGDERAWNLLRAGFGSMVWAMSSGRCPVTFVITKWDLLDHLDPNEDERLRIVRDMLSADPRFDGLVGAHGRRRVVRLIPVSAVGHDFTMMRDGVNVKKKHGHFEPSHVELPLAAVIPDIVRQVDAPRHRSIFPTILLALGAIIAGLLGGGATTSEWAAMIAASMQGDGNDTRSGAPAKLRDAQVSVVHQMELQVARLEGRLPSSRLAG